MAQGGSGLRTTCRWLRVGADRCYTAERCDTLDGAGGNERGFDTAFRYAPGDFLSVWRSCNNGFVEAHSQSERNGQMVRRTPSEVAQHLIASSPVDPETGCWVWRHSRVQGYGQMTAATITGELRPIRTHRLAWLLFRGPIPPRMHLHHTCENRACCNPEHLRLLSPQKHRAEHVGKTCPSGHSDRWTTAANGRRVCLECERLRSRTRTRPCYWCGGPAKGRQDKEPECRQCFMAHRVFVGNNAFVSGVPTKAAA